MDHGASSRVEPAFLEWHRKGVDSSPISGTGVWLRTYVGNEVREEKELRLLQVVPDEQHVLVLVFLDTSNAFVEARHSKQASVIDEHL